MCSREPIRVVPAKQALCEASDEDKGAKTTSLSTISVGTPTNACIDLTAPASEELGNLVVALVDDDSLLTPVVIPTRRVRAKCIGDNTVATATTSTDIAAPQTSACSNLTVPASEEGAFMTSGAAPHNSECSNLTMATLQEGANTRKRTLRIKGATCGKRDRATPLHTDESCPPFLAELIAHQKLRQNSSWSPLKARSYCKASTGDTATENFYHRNDVFKKPSARGYCRNSPAKAGGRSTRRPMFLDSHLEPFDPNVHSQLVALSDATPKPWCLKRQPQNMQDSIGTLPKSKHTLLKFDVGRFAVKERDSSARGAQTKGRTQDPLEFALSTNAKPRCKKPRHVC